MLWYSPSCLGCAPLNREIANVLQQIERDANLNGENVYVTHTRDGRHGSGTRHYQGDAVDILPLRETIFVKGMYGPNIDIAKEPDHVHIEWDPK